MFLKSKTSLALRVGINIDSLQGGEGGRQAGRGGRTRGLTWSESDEPENSGFFTLTLSPPVEIVSSWKINCGGVGTIAGKSTASFLTA